jgi:hypothetical protein
MLASPSPMKLSNSVNVFASARVRRVLTPVDHERRVAVRPRVVAELLVEVPLVLPWGYVWKHYVLVPADRWR